jgi:hypothetical protein
LAAAAAESVEVAKVDALRVAAACVLELDEVAAAAAAAAAD